MVQTQAPNSNTNSLHLAAETSPTVCGHQCGIQKAACPCAHQVDRKEVSVSINVRHLRNILESGFRVPHLVTCYLEDPVIP